MAITRYSPTTIAKDKEREKITFTVDTKQVIGRGSYGTIYLASTQKTPKKFAAKCITTNNEKEMLRCEKEIQIMHKLTKSCAPYVITLVTHRINDSINPPSRQYIFIMPYAQNGTLTKWLADTYVLTPNRLTNIMLGTAKALAHVHSQNIIHSDIKTDNILLNENFEPLLADFGLSIDLSLDQHREIDADGSRRFAKPVGTPIYFAPELLFHGQSNSKEADIYALSLVFWQLLARERLPYPEIQSFEWFKLHVGYKGKRSAIPPCPNKIASLITWGWAQKPLQRPTADQIARELEAYHQTPHSDTEFQATEKDALLPANKNSGQTINIRDQLDSSDTQTQCCSLFPQIGFCGIL